VENDAIGYVPEFRIMSRVTDAAMKTAVDSCAFEVEAWSLKGFAGPKGPTESTMTASAT
jgi:hypothetical protein